ncbi:hypothetical protein CASFOL_012453 [Castilleja foliolosa]|uniref:Ubiquitin-like domain-containing protein n=1 Tax=Castilleja foliolosa TaxID=1961234 RepID=A0ABD3DH44_9LAMI
MENLPPGEGSGVSDIAGQSSDSTLQINIKTLDSRVFSFRVDKEISVSDFKEKIANQVGVPVGQQRIIFRGKVLKDDHHLYEYNTDVEHGDTLHLVERQPQPPPGPNTGDTTSSNSTGGFDPSAGGPRNRIGQIAHSVVLGTLNVGDSGPGEAAVPDLSRVIGAVLSSIGIGSLAGGTQPGVQIPHGNETGQSQANAGSQSQGGILFGPFQAGQSGSNPMQNPVGVAIPVPTLNMPIPDSLNTLTEFMNRMELALSQNGTQQNQSPTASGSLPTPELPVNSLGFPSVEALTTVLRHAQRLLSDHVVPTLSQTAGRLDQEGGSSDPAVRGQVQIESVHLGVAMQHLGALLLELGRTILTLRIRQSPGESYVNAGPAVYISPSGPNPIMAQPFPLQTSPLFGASTGVTQNHVPMGPFGNVTRNVNIHIHTGASLAPLVPLVGNRAPNGEETRGQRAGRSPDPSSASSTVAQINAQLRNLTANMQGNQAPSGSTNQEQLAGAGVRDNETTQPSGMDNQKAKNDTSTGPDGSSHNSSSMSGPAESLEGPSGSSQGNSNQDGSSGVPLGLGLGGLQPKRRASLSRPQANSDGASSSAAAVGQQVLQSLASLSSSGGANPPSSGHPSVPARGVLGNMPSARQNTNNDNIDIADAMSQALGNSSLDGLLAGVSQQTGVGSPDMLRNMLQQFTQNPAMGNMMNQIAQQIDGQDLGSVFSGGGGQAGGGFDLSRMMQQMMPIVSQALGGMSQQNPTPGPGLLENSSRRDVGPTNDDPQINLQQVVQSLERQSSPEEIFRSVVNAAAHLSRSDESLVIALCVPTLAQEFMDMLLLDLSGRLEDGV